MLSVMSWIKVATAMEINLINQIPIFNLALHLVQVVKILGVMRQALI